jgi:4-amino-4-deoxy-L-arabinose transferase-like glycosyltransferase
MGCQDVTDATHIEPVHGLPEWLERLAGRPMMAGLALLALCLAVYLPGVLRLPAVDRTEVVYAETTRDMVARQAWLDPRFGDVVHQFRPIGTYWAQGVAAVAAGPELSRSIPVYRVPGLIAVTLAVLALYWLAGPLVGGGTALLAAGLFAVTPLTVLVSQLAITEGLSLLPSVIAMLALLRIYVAREEDNGRVLALLFWAAVGFGIVLNALLVPILVVATLVALFVMDRDIAWLKRLRPLIGVPIALVIASPWLIVRAHQDGVPFSGMDWTNFIEALGGSQDMKLRAMPGTFVLAMLLGFLPGTALLAPAMLKLWNGREQRIAKFLLAWVIGYLAYLELLSSKPGTYTVQVMFPALALGVAMLVATHSERQSLPRWHAIPWPPLAALFVLLLFAGVYGFVGAWPGVLAALMIIATAGLFFASAQAGSAGQLNDWALSGIAALGFFAVTLLGIVFPSLDRLWPAEQIRRTVVAACPAYKTTADQMGLLGLREPSGHFVLGASRSLQTPEAIATAQPKLSIVEARWMDRYAKAMAAAGGQPGTQLTCLSTYNVMRGCPLNFFVLGRDVAGLCAPLNSDACAQSVSSSELSKACD